MARQTRRWTARGLLGGLFLAAVAVVVLAAFITNGEPPFRHVIFFIGDGMQLENEVAASRYLYGADRALAWHGFPGRFAVSTWDVTTYDRFAWQGQRPRFERKTFFPELGYDIGRGGLRPYPDQLTGFDNAYFLTPLPPYGSPDNRGAGIPATDSASAATAFATGHKTDSGNISWLPGDPPEGRLMTVAEKVRAFRGAAIGVVSTVAFNHATPAAFVSHSPGRSNYYSGYRDSTQPGLADEIIRVVKPEVVIGGGHPLTSNPTFDTKRGYISRPLYDALRSSPEYVLAERQPGTDGARTLAAAAESAVAGRKKLFGLFGGPGGGFEPPVAEDRPGAPLVRRGSVEDPPLKDATLAALRVLSQDEDGFFLLVEQGDIDWANHDNDFQGMVGSMWDLEEAVKAAVEFVDRPFDAIDWGNTVLLVTADHATGFMRLDPGKPLSRGDLPRQESLAGTSTVQGKSVSRPATRQVLPHNSPAPAPAYTPPLLYPDEEVSFGTAGHTNELVTLAVLGDAVPFFRAYEGRWYAAPIIDNTQVHAALSEALKVTRNPGPLRRLGEAISRLLRSGRRGATKSPGRR
ncbi:MAG: alkaline phosphatase [Candidatus Aminicenantes bacterium]|nr:alkaline phosphatase [Candidatus Aminicenantes bacterium]